MMQRFYSLIIIVVMITIGSMPMAAAEEWETVLEAAKKEGTVSVSGPVGAERRDALTLAFEKKYGIKVEYWGDRGSAVGPKLSAERNAGKFLWDVFVGGTTSGMIRETMFDPIEPALILPQVKDPKQWRGGGIEYLGRYLVMTLSQRGTLFINPNVIKPDSITSYKDLLNPKYKGKMVLDDPTMAGPGQATIQFFYLHPELGPNFIRELAKQQITVLRDYAQELDCIAREKCLVAIGVSDIFTEARMKAGMPITLLDPRKLKEHSDINPGAGGLALFNRAPHPNAAKVYINWLLSKEGQTDFARVNGYISARLDVSTAHSPWRVPIPGAINTYDQKAQDVIEDMIVVFKEAFGRK